MRRSVTPPLPLLLLLCAALVGGLPAARPGDTEHADQQQPDSDQRLYDQQAKDQHQLLQDRERLLHDQQRQEEDRQKQSLWQQQLSEQQERDQQRLLADQQQLERDQQRNQEDQIQQLRQREEEKVLLDYQQQVLRTQSQQQQQALVSESRAAGDEPAADNVDTPELVNVPAHEDALSHSDPALPSIESLLIYGDGGEHAADDVVHDTADIRAGSASVRKIVIANALSVESLETKKNDESPTDQGRQLQDEGVSTSTSGTSTSEERERPQLTAEEAADSDGQAPPDVTPPDSQMEMNHTDFGDQKKEQHGTAVSPEQVFSMDSSEIEKLSKPKEPITDNEDSTANAAEPADIDMMPLAETAEPAAVQCASDSSCMLKADDCDRPTSGTGQVRKPPHNLRTCIGTWTRPWSGTPGRICTTSGSRVGQRGRARDRGSK